MKKDPILSFVCCMLISSMSMAQQSSLPADTIPSMSEVIIRGYESQRRSLETPVSAGVITARDMQRFSNASLVPAVNIIPGVRMEERSPGSYRFTIRGSLLRSPFGVRNIKVYWNDIPFTDAGGNSYLNLVDQSSIDEMEILKGPGGSLYGANTGGVIILHTDDPLAPEAGKSEHDGRIQVTAGSYGLFAENARWNFHNKAFSSTVTQSHTQSDGYRDNTRLRRDVVQWNGTAHWSAKDKLNWIALYADMYYQTPGGLTLAQMRNNPKQARPATPALPGAADQKAAIYNKTILAGVSNEHQFNASWSNVTSVMLSYTDFKNPFITNFETRAEINTGLRSKFIYQQQSGEQHYKFAAGAEWLYNSSVINNYGNRRGQRDTIQYKDHLSGGQFFPFIQGEWLAGKKFQLQAGVSTNFFLFHYQRLTDADNSRKKKTLEEQLLPRFAALYRLTSAVSLYASASKGFSPPAIAEIRPSEGTIHSNLQPESGWNYEVGLKTSMLQGRLQLDVTAYQFKLQDAIVRRTTDIGAEYFVNAGGTDQKGLEAYGSYMLVRQSPGFLTHARIWSSATFNDFSFTDYKVTNSDYSGNALTGVAKQIVCVGIDLYFKGGFYLNASYTHTSKMPLNDSSTAYAPAYDLVFGRVGWKKKFNALSLELFAGTDNALNKLYSLGNDINAVGNRYYNPAALRNYYGGVIVTF